MALEVACVVMSLILANWQPIQDVFHGIEFSDIRHTILVVNIHGDCVISRKNNMHSRSSVSGPAPFRPYSCERSRVALPYTEYLKYGKKSWCKWLFHNTFVFIVMRCNSFKCWHQFHFTFSEFFKIFVYKLTHSLWNLLEKISYKKYCYLGWFSR